MIDNIAVFAVTTVIVGVIWSGLDLLQKKPTRFLDPKEGIIITILLTAAYSIIDMFFESKIFHSFAERLLFSASVATTVIVISPLLWKMKLRFQKKTR